MVLHQMCKVSFLFCSLLLFLFRACCFLRCLFFCVSIPTYPPPPLVILPPLSFPGVGGGGPSLGQPKNFRCGSLCCCVGDSVVCLRLPSLLPRRQNHHPSAAQSIPVEGGEHVQDFKVNLSKTKKFYTEPVKE